jgi:cytochrome c biogenesis protein CcdA/thiol-disulfide isomerase/thioredoxin
MLLLFGAFVAGMLTVLAPCVLPLLPVIIGGSVSGETTDRKRPIIIAVSLAASLILFTLLLKATTVLIGIPPESINYISGSIIILLGIATLFPMVYEKISFKLGFASRSQKMLNSGNQNKNKHVGAIITGAALGPVFSSCSPVYAYIIATILPADFALAMSYIIAYVLGLSFVLLLVGIFSQRFISKVRWAANPKGIFQKVLAIIFIIVGVLVFTGTTTQVQTWVSKNTPFDFDGLSAKFIPDKSNRVSQDGIYNVRPIEAPEFVSLENWINSEPLTKEELSGKVYLVDFWTYSCINCIRTQPYLKAWYETYKDDGFEIIGVHAPEFSFEKVPKNVEKATKEAGLKYPIALDNDFATWNAFNNQFWPASYLVDETGNIRRVHFGEGGYEETEEAIRGLLKEKNGTDPGARAQTTKGRTSGEDETPETYLGSRRASNFVGDTRLITGENKVFKAEDELEINQWTLDGTWDVSAENITAKSNSVLRIRIAAKEAYLVMGSEESQDVKVLLDNKLINKTKFAGSDVQSSKVSVENFELYRLVEYPKFNGGLHP